jgi:hypothetical protein
MLKPFRIWGEMEGTTEDNKAKEGKVSPKSLEAHSFFIQFTTPFALQGWWVGVRNTAFQV